MKEVVIFMTFMTMEREVFVIKGLDSVRILKGDTDRVGYSLLYFHINAYSTIQGIPPFLGNI